MRRIKTLLERLEAKYIPEPNSGCWLWFGAISRSGYGNIWVRDEGKNRNLLAHRASWRVYCNEEPHPSVKVCHHCDVPLCVNPDHLFLGSQLDNVADCLRKGRARKSSPKGSLNGMSVLTENGVWNILRSKEKYRELAAIYNCSISTIGMVKRGYNWPHIFQQWQSEQANSRTEARL